MNDLLEQEVRQRRAAHALLLRTTSAESLSIIQMSTDGWIQYNADVLTTNQSFIYSTQQAIM
jgi:hypothetical protein